MVSSDGVTREISLHRIFIKNKISVENSRRRIFPNKINESSPDERYFLIEFWASVQVSKTPILCVRENQRQATRVETMVHGDGCVLYQTARASTCALPLNLPARAPSRLCTMGSIELFKLDLPLTHVIPSSVYFSHTRWTRLQIGV